MRLCNEDPDKQSVYYAEQVSFKGTLYQEPLHSDDFMILADRLFTHDWWERHNVPVPVIEPTTSMDMSSYAWIYRNRVHMDPVIRIAPHDINPHVLSHEAAHIAQYHFYKPSSYGLTEVHGREFRATYASVVEIVLGLHAATVLRASFDKFVTVRPEHAPGMPGSIMTVPRPKPEHDPTGAGLFPIWRLEQQKAELDKLQPVVSSTHRLNGAIAL